MKAATGEGAAIVLHLPLKSALPNLTDHQLKLDGAITPATNTLALTPILIAALMSMTVESVASVKNDLSPPAGEALVMPQLPTPALVIANLNVQPNADPEILLLFVILMLGKPWNSNAVTTIASCVVVETIANSVVVETIAKSVVVEKIAKSVVVEMIAKSVVVETIEKSVVVEMIAKSVAAETIAKSVVVEMTAKFVVVEMIARCGEVHRLHAKVNQTGDRCGLLPIDPRTTAISASIALCAVPSVKNVLHVTNVTNCQLAAFQLPIVSVSKNVSENVSTILPFLKIILLI